MKKIIYSVLIVQILFFTACSNNKKDECECTVKLHLVGENCCDNNMYNCNCEKNNDSQDISEANDSEANDSESSGSEDSGSEDSITIEFKEFLEKWDLFMLYKNACTSVTDAIKFPKPFTHEDQVNFANLPAEIFYSMSTCGLLETLLNHPSNRILGPWCSICSDPFRQAVTLFNFELRHNRVATELMGRDDCFSVLASKYLMIIRDERKTDSQTEYFEMLLASDMFMLATNENEKVKLMAMALERGGSKTEFTGYSSYIMIAIMKAFYYPPFMNEVNANLIEYIWGYSNLDDYDILKYAEDFLNQQK